MVKKIKEEHNLLKAALRDLENQLGKLGSSKKIQESKLNSVANKLSQVQEMELRLREAISRLMKTETDLGKQKEDTVNRLSNLKKKIEKLQIIQRDLKEV